MSPARGFQIAFLVLAIQFFVALIAARVAPLLAWPGVTVNLVGMAILFPLAVAILASVPGLRRSCLEELRRPMSPDARIEVAIVSLGKITVPFAVAGAVVLWAFAIGEPSILATKLMSNDPLEAWESTTSSPEIFRKLLFAWTLAPIVEELVFRSFLYRAWERQWGWIPSLLLTSAVFGLFHPTHMATAFLASVVYTCILRRTGTIRAPILVHMAYNVLISWPFIGQFLLTLEGRELARLSTWTVELACVVFVAIALPVYVALSRTDARQAALR
jgi:membrane protease YdiL (CAAX protease family)